MIFGIGNDIVEVERIKQKLDNPLFISRIFTENEINYCKSMTHSAEHFSARFAAKEAFFKAFGTGIIGNFEFTDVEVINSVTGAPSICLHAGTLIEIQKSEIKNIFLSMSHEKGYAIATVIIEK